MRVTVSRSHCLDAMRMVAGLISGRPSAGDIGRKPGPKKLVRLAVSRDGLQIFGGEKEGFATVFLPARMNEPYDSGCALVQPWRLIEMLQNGKGEDVRFGVTLRDAVSVTMRDAKFEIESGDPDLFPLQIPSEIPLVATVYSSPLRQAMQRTVFTAGKDDPVLETFAFNVVCFDISSELWLCATDGGNLSLAKVADAKRPAANAGRVSDLKLAVPRGSVADLLSMVADELQQVEIRSDDRLVSFSFNARGLAVQFYSSLVARRMPAYRKVVPDLRGRACYVLKPAELRAAASLIEPFSESGADIHVTANTWRFEGQRANVGEGWHEIPVCGPDGIHSRLRLPPKMLERFAGSAPPESIEALIGDAGEPLLFRSEGWTFVMMQCAEAPAPVASPMHAYQPAAAAS